MTSGFSGNLALFNVEYCHVHYDCVEPNKFLLLLHTHTHSAVHVYAGRHPLSPSFAALIVAGAAEIVMSHKRRKLSL